MTENWLQYFVKYVEVKKKLETAYNWKSIFLSGKVETLLQGFQDFDSPENLIEIYNYKRKLLRSHLKEKMKQTVEHVINRIPEYDRDFPWRMQSWKKENAVLAVMQLRNPVTDQYLKIAYTPSV